MTAAVLTILDDDSTPVAGNVSYTTGEDTPLTVAAPGVLANDTNADGTPFTAVLVAGPTNGTLSFNPDGSFTYTPNANFNGTDSFTFRAATGANSSNMATVTITVTPVNDAPVAVNDSYTGLVAGTAFTVAAPGVLANDTDVEGEPADRPAGLRPGQRPARLQRQRFTYTPAAKQSECVAGCARLTSSYCSTTRG